MNYRERIAVEPGKRGGRPCIRGLRITVYDVLDQLSAGMTAEEIIEDFPELELEDIRACLGFAADRERHIIGLHHLASGRQCLESCCEATLAGQPRDHQHG